MWTCTVPTTASRGPSLPRSSFEHSKPLTGANYDVALGEDYFTDDDGLIHEPNIDKLRYANVTQGCAEGLFCPAHGLTRGQLAALLHRALG